VKISSIIDLFCVCDRTVSISAILWLTGCGLYKMRLLIVVKSIPLSFPFSYFGTAPFLIDQVDQFASAEEPLSVFYSSREK